jgi:hypothetical protein
VSRHTSNSPNSASQNNTKACAGNTKLTTTRGNVRRRNRTWESELEGLDLEQVLGVRPHPAAAGVRERGRTIGALYGLDPGVAAWQATRASEELGFGKRGGFALARHRSRERAWSGVEQQQMRIWNRRRARRQRELVGTRKSGKKERGLVDLCLWACGTREAGDAATLEASTIWV